MLLIVYIALHTPDKVFLDDGSEPRELRDLQDSYSTCKAETSLAARVYCMSNSVAPSTVAASFAETTTTSAATDPSTSAAIPLADPLPTIVPAATYCNRNECSQLLDLWLLLAM